MNKTKELCLSAMFTSLLCASAFIRIPTPLLPITLQTLFVGLSGIVLGSKKSAVSTGVYILLGLTGLPVFAEGGGISYILKPSFGYLLGFILASFITGKMAEKEMSLKNYIFSTLTGMLAIYAVGVTYYFLISRFYLGNEIEIKNLFVYCFLLTLPGDVVMCIFSSIVGKRLKRIFKT